MATIGYAELPVPAGHQAPTVPADLASFAEAVDPHLRHNAVNAADRDNRFSEAPAHTLVTADNGSMWVKTSATSNTWVTIWEPPPGWDRTITLKPGFQTGNVTIGLMRLDGGRRIELKGRIERVDGTPMSDPFSINLGSVPADCVPPGLRTWAGCCSLTGDTTDSTGRLEILGTSSSSSSGVAGDILWNYQGTGGTSWVDISGYYWRV